MALAAAVRGSLAELDHDDTAAEAVQVLCELVTSAWGDLGSTIGATIRADGGLAKLVRLLQWFSMMPSTDEHAIAMRIDLLVLLGNLASDAVDASSALTKRELLACGGPSALLACLYTDVVEVLMLTLGALQNLADEAEWARTLAAGSALTELERCLALYDEDSLVAHYAAGCLKNMS